MDHPHGNEPWLSKDSCGHFVQFYERDEFLVQTVASFIGAGLGAGEGAVVIATASHCQGIEKQLSDNGIDLAVVKARGQYVALEAAETISKFESDGCLDESLFRNVIGPVIENIGQGRPGVRAFGEMVALLWADRKRAAAIRLEELWNELSKVHRFRLFCAYPMNGFCRASDDKDFERICDAHERSLPSEDHFGRNNDERLRQVAALQRKALALEDEIKSRQAIEQKLRRREAELTDFVENASVGLHWVRPDGLIQWANRAEYELLGYSADEYIGRNIAEFHVEPMLIKDILARLTRGERIRECEARLRCKDGSIKTVVIDSCVLWDNGTFVHTQCFTRDITKRKRAEEALRGSEARLRQLISLMPAAVYTCDGAGRIAFFNRHAGELWGQEPVLGDSDQKFCGSFKLWLPDGAPLPHDQTPMAAAVRRGVATRNREVIIERPDGSRITASVNIDPLRDEAGNLAGAINVFQDVTERKRAEEKLRESEGRFRAVLDNSATVIYVKDCSGRYLLVNKCFERHFHVMEKEALGRTDFDLFAGEMAKRFRENDAQVIRTGEPLEIEEIAPHADGPHTYISVKFPLRRTDGSIYAVAGISTDITEWIRAQESTARLAAIVEHSDDAIFSTDLNGVIKSWNRGAHRLYGYAAEEAIGQPVTFFVPDERQSEELGIYARIRNGEPIENFETTRRRKDGSLFYVSLTISPVKDGRGNVIGASKVARDITDKIRAKETLERTVAERTAQLRDTVAELEAFSYSVAHDMRAPLRAMTTYSRLLEQDFGQALPPEAKSFTRRIATGAQRLDALITDVLNYSKVARDEMVLDRIEVENLIREVIDSYPDLKECGVTILVQSPIPPVIGNQAALTQCISNLLANAIKFVAPGVIPRVLVRADTTSDHVRLWFEDNGIGIPQEGQERIFRMFQRLNPATQFQGTGIGLTIVRKAVERMGGQVGVESESGAGSRFWIELKRAA